MANHACMDLQIAEAQPFISKECSRFSAKLTQLQIRLDGGFTHDALHDHVVGQLLL